MEGQTNIARKVYELVPLTESWNVNKIAMEAARQQGSVANFRIIHGCLAALVRAGLIHESSKNEYTKIPVKGYVPPLANTEDQPPPTHTEDDVERKTLSIPQKTPVPNFVPPADDDIEETVQVETKPTASTDNKSNAMDRLGELEKKLNTVAGTLLNLQGTLTSLQANLKSMITEVSDIAVEVQTEVEAANNGAEKLHALKAILKSLG